MRKNDTYRSQFRLPYELYEKLKEESEKNHRSLNAEIVARLEKTVRDDELDRNPNAVKIPDIPDRSDYIEIRDNLLSAVAQIEALLQSEGKDD